MTIENPPSTGPARSWLRLAVKGTTWAVTALVVAWVLFVFAGPNRHAVIAGKIYRSSQPSGSQIASQVKAKGIRTVLNLRGFCAGVDWYESEQRAIRDAGANLEDVTMSAKCLPAPGELRRIIDVFDHAEYPILIHCKEGKDRTGLAAATALLLYTDATVTVARRELGAHLGHLPVGRTVAMDDFFDRYERWLANRNGSHTPARYRDWALNHYIPGVGRAEIAFQSTPTKSVVRGQSLALPVRVTNRSEDEWEFKPGATSAIHLGYLLVRDGTPVYESQAGMFRRTVKPGESIDLNVALPPLRVPGEYLLRLEMKDFRGAGIPDRASAFSKFGDDPVDVVFRVE